jgi:DNA-binding response OmpR family regulator/phage shock protein A
VKPRILVVEDENAIRIALKGLLTREGYEVDLAIDGESAIEQLGTQSYDLVLTDLALGHGASGMDVLKRVKELRAETAVVMITAHGNEKIAVEAMKAGAEDYVPKPFDNDEIRVLVRRAIDRHRLEREHRLLLDQIQRDYSYENLIGSGTAMRKVFETIQKVAETDLSVMIRGESGTGKELVAQALHNRSPRKNRPFITVNCAAISRELVESELFGHEKGSFTGADSRRLGRFEAADGGTIFLDEIGDMAPETQAKVLRVLQEKKLERVGSTQSIEVDVRVISATHRDLEKEVAADDFREDLYYRLKVVEIELPPPARSHRGHSGALPSLPRPGGRATGPAAEAARARGARHADASLLAGQRSRAAKRARAGGGPGRRRRHRGRRPASAGRVVLRRSGCAGRGHDLRRRQASDRRVLRTRLPSQRSARERRERLPHRPGHWDGAAEPATEDPRAGSSLRGLGQRKRSEDRYRERRRRMSMHRPEGFIARLRSLMSGIFQRWVREREHESPEVVYEQAIGERVRQYRELKSAVAGILYLRAKLESEISDRRAEIARLHDDARRAVRRSQDDVSLTLIAQKQQLFEELERAEDELKTVREQAEEAKGNLVLYREEIRSLVREKGRMLATLANAKARRRLQVAIEGLSTDAELDALEGVREYVTRLTMEGDVDKELGDTGLRGRLREFRDEARMQSAQSELEQLKKEAQAHTLTETSAGTYAAAAAAPAAG